MEFNLEQAAALLSRTPAVLRALLADLPEAWLHSTEGGATWSPYVVVGHLIHAEKTDWLPRARIILQSGESAAFPPFDRFAQFRESEGKTLEELLTTFAELRAASLQALQQLELTPDDLQKTGRHPEFGRVTLAQLLATWVTHDQTHLVQISRTFARQYQEAVGPWRAYLSVLN